jgi:glycosyltransferase involved in cell wall biosynthesis
VTAAAPRVALVSVGIGRVQRGFERLVSDLFALVRGEVDVTLFKSGGERTPREKVPPFLRPTTGVARRLPLGGMAGRAEYNRDCLAFGLTLLPALVTGRFDIVHCIDPPLAAVLARLLRAARLSPRLLFTEACEMPPAYYPRVDHVHHIGKSSYDAAIAAGVPASFMTLVPCGVRVDRFTAEADRQALRQKHGVAPDTFVVLAVSAVKRTHKRVEHLIEEVARVPGDVLLWIDGNPEDPTLPELARERLGPRCRITHVPSSDVPELYRVADVLAHAALSESFGIAIVEALYSGTPVLVHDAPHFEWLVGGRDGLVDMASPGRLAAGLRELRSRPPASRTAVAEQARQRFDWQALRPDYLDLYRRVAAGTVPARASA